MISSSMLTPSSVPSLQGQSPTTPSSQAFVSLNPNALANLPMNNSSLTTGLVSALSAYGGGQPSPVSSVPQMYYGSSGFGNDCLNTRSGDNTLNALNTMNPFVRHNRLINGLTALTNTQPSTLAATPSMPTLGEPNTIGQSLPSSLSSGLHCNLNSGQNNALGHPYNVLG